MICLANLHEHTPQQVFDHIATHLLTQNAKSTDGAQGCLYRGKLGRRCAAGCVIGDSEYTIQMDGGFGENGTSWNDLIDDGIITQTAHRKLISEMQAIHDGFEVEGWKEQLEKYADHYGFSHKIFREFE
jgi:hypothetical protein